MRASTSLLSSARPPTRPAPRATRPPIGGVERGQQQQQAQATMQQQAEQRLRGGTKKTLWQSWMSLTPRTRMTCGFALAVFSIFGIMASDKLEEVIPADNARKPRAVGPPTTSSSV